MDWSPLMRTSAAHYARNRTWIPKAPQRRWTAVGIALVFGLALIVVPPLDIAAFGEAIAGWWIVVGVGTLLGALSGNRVGVEVERQQDGRR